MESVWSIQDRLRELRGSLSPEAAKVYRALKVALERHSSSTGSRPGFESVFKEWLEVEFENAYTLDVRQVGSWNQWQITVDNGPAICCSVRLELLCEDPDLLWAIRKRAGAVKDVLLESGARWKRKLEGQREGTEKLQSLHAFKKECERRALCILDRDYSWNSRSSGPSGRGGSEGREEEEHFLGPRLVASFACSGCQNTWTTHNARFRPDREAVMLQYCSKCGEAGHASSWRRDDENSWADLGQEGGKRSGAHQSDLCEACRQFGNCMGIFHDPFVISTALALTAGHWISWKAASEESPELLAADLGVDFQHVQALLRPHVHVAQGQARGQRWAKKTFAIEDEQPQGGSRALVRSETASSASDRPPMHKKRVIKNQALYDKMIRGMPPLEAQAAPPPPAAARPLEATPPLPSREQPLEATPPLPSREQQLEATPPLPSREQPLEATPPLPSHEQALEARPGKKKANKMTAEFLAPTSSPESAPASAWATVPVVQGSAPAAAPPLESAPASAAAAPPPPPPLPTPAAASAAPASAPGSAAPPGPPPPPPPPEPAGAAEDRLAAAAVPAAVAPLLGGLPPLRRVQLVGATREEEVYALAEDSLSISANDVSAVFERAVRSARLRGAQIVD